MESNIKEVKGVNEYGEMHLGNPNHNTFPDIFDHIHCIVNDLRCLSSSHIEKLIQKNIIIINYLGPASATLFSFPVQD